MMPYVIAGIIILLENLVIAYFYFKVFPKEYC